MTPYALRNVKDTLCIDGGHSQHQFGVNLVGFHAIIFSVKWYSSAEGSTLGASHS